MTFLVLAMPLAPRRKKRMWCLSYRDRVDDTLYCTGDLGDAQDEQEFVTFVRGELICIHVLQNVSAGHRQENLVHGENVLRFERDGFERPGIRTDRNNALVHQIFCSID